MEIAPYIEPIMIVHFAACALLTGLIWIIQLIHYPAFAEVDPSRFPKFHAFHSSRITWIVAPAMLIELVTALLMAIATLPSLLLSYTNLIFVVLTWLSTALVSVPIHNKLSRGYDGVQVNKLVLTNWPRTILWTIRFVALIIVLT